LVRGTKPIRCTACERERNGKAATDEHHVASKNNHPLTVTVPVNERRAILDGDADGLEQDDAGEPERVPAIMAAAAVLRGAVDTILYLIDKGIDWVIALMETLSKFCANVWGDGWWNNTPLAAFAPSR
jgi:hypothetical protein